MQRPTIGNLVTAALVLVAIGVMPPASQGVEGETSPMAAVSDLSEETEACVDCHSLVTPGIVSDWAASH